VGGKNHTGGDIISVSFSIWYGSQPEAHRELDAKVRTGRPALAGAPIGAGPARASKMEEREQGGTSLLATKEKTTRDKDTAAEKPADVRSTSHSKSKAALVEKMIKSIEKKFDEKEVKANLGDLIRLLQLRKELEEEHPQEIKVTWVEPSEEESASET
jgi:hypothetical protein